MTDGPVTVADLRPVDLFDDLDDDAARASGSAVARQRRFEPDEIVAEVAEPPPGLILLLEGELQALVVDGERTEPAGRQQPPTWIGAIAVLTDGELGVRMQAETAGRIALVEPDDFRRLVFAQPAVHARVMHQVAPVMSRITGMEQNRERLASLGTMAAGLAHELEQPGRRRAAAPRRRWRRRWRRSPRPWAASWSPASSAPRPKGWLPSSGRRSPAPRGGPPSTRSTSPTPRTT